MLVSHSRALAEGLAELAGQMAPDVALLPAGGAEDGGLGTGFDRVLTAVESAVADGRSAVVLTDLGSAVLTTESVLEALDADDAARVRIAEAPIVEGAVEAAVAAQGGGDLDAVLAAALHAGQVFATSAASGEQSLPGAAPPGSAPERSAVDTAAGASAGRDAGDEPAAGAAPAGGGRSGLADGPTVRATVVLRNRLGLHARPAAALARTASAFRAHVTVSGADARSVIELVGLGAVGGTEVVVMATGDDARRAVHAVVAELEEGFGEA